MPAIANITVKKNDGTTDIVYTAMNPSSGDTVPALYRQENLTVPPGSRPTLEVRSRNNGQKTARRVDVAYQYPQVYTDTNTGLKMVRNRAVFSGSFLLPQEVPTEDTNEAISQFVNILASAAMKDVLKSGFAPT